MKLFKKMLGALLIAGTMASGLSAMEADDSSVSTQNVTQDPSLKRAIRNYCAALTKANAVLTETNKKLTTVLKKSKKEKAPASLAGRTTPAKPKKEEAPTSSLPVRLLNGSKRLLKHFATYPISFLGACLCFYMGRFTIEKAFSGPERLASLQAALIFYGIVDLLIKGALSDGNATLGDKLTTLAKTTWNNKIKVSSGLLIAGYVGFNIPEALSLIGTLGALICAHNLV